MLNVVAGINLPERELLLTEDALRFVEGLGDRPPRPMECPVPPEMFNFDISFANPAPDAPGRGLLGV